MAKVRFVMSFLQTQLADVYIHVLYTDLDVVPLLPGQRMDAYGCIVSKWNHTFRIQMEPEPLGTSWM